MSVTLSKVYEFVYRGHLAEEALDREGRQNCRLIKFADEEIARALSLDVLDDLLVVNARATAIVYAAIAAFENSVRALVVNTLMEKFQEEWWEKGVSHSIRERGQKRMEDEQIAKWHTQRGQDPINYTTFGDLKNIMHNNWDAFEDLVGSLAWASSIFDVIERSRNVIMHSGMLEREDIERLGVNIRDWVKQVGA
jgi:hypothetical protein